MSATFDDLAKQYVAVWNETDPQLRRKAIDALWSADAVYCDPLGTARGRAAIDATIAGAQEQFPGMSFRLVGAVDGHHEQFRFTWELGPEEGPAPVVGFDVATVDADGRLNQVLGFLDRVPS
ncbi:SnoaL-like protein [Tamaricihabitans halophyticus]|uniref:SnoaL-like protein n=1 Tax=Tamaricihabitans halophyticus TaxID=1262583 RepID=A0A4R2R3T5_9PSEU|nr:nuclear transport factor 2 family protein [Tamaricihabitans halophyticus]TCP57510.1 SnoaL-like protein [Tamaricihabitans halophyticus]